MFDKYLVTGATGFLGRAVAEELVHRRAQVYALVLHNDPYINLLPKEVHTVIGDVCDESSLADFFADADGRTCVIHCAGIVSVASRPGSRLYQVNVGCTTGTCAVTSSLWLSTGFGCVLGSLLSSCGPAAARDRTATGRSKP